MAPCGCKKRQHPIIQQPAQVPATIRLTENQPQPEEKVVSEDEQKIIQQIAEELQKLHAQNQ